MIPTRWALYPFQPIYVWASVGSAQQPNIHPQWRFYQTMFPPIYIWRSEGTSPSPPGGGFQEPPYFISNTGRMMNRRGM